jgi:hypothetical protein
MKIILITENRICLILFLKEKIEINEMTGTTIEIAVNPQMFDTIVFPVGVTNETPLKLTR